jgi:hypothetical protein
MYPTNSARRHPHHDVQPCGGVPALSSPAAGRHTTPPGAVPLPRRDERSRTHVLSAESATLPNPPGVPDRALRKAAQQLMAGHRCVSPDETRCANPRCASDAAYPCTPARTAMRLALASRLPFYMRMTALLDAQTCVVPPSHFGLASAGADGDDGRMISAVEALSPLADVVAPDTELMSAVGA